MSFFRACIIFCLLLGMALSIPGQANAMAGKGKPAPNFSLTTVAGTKLDLNALRGKVVVIDFFATWCPPCRDAIPHLIDLQRRFGAKGLQVAGLSADDEDETRTVREFVTNNRINYPVAITSEELRDEYGLRSIPVLFVIDKKGVVIEVFRGLGGDMTKRLDDLVQKLLVN